MENGDENMLLRIPDGKNPVSNISESFWEIRLDESQFLEIEFLERLGDVEICLQDEKGNTVYELHVPTAPTFHIIIDVQNWIPGLYSIQIKNSVKKEKTALCWFRTTYFLFLKQHLFKESELRLFAS